MFQAAFPYIGGGTLHCLEKISGSFKSLQCISATIESRNIRHLYYIIFTVFRKSELLKSIFLTSWVPIIGVLEVQFLYFCNSEKRNVTILILTILSIVILNQSYQSYPKSFPCIMEMCITGYGVMDNSVHSTWKSKVQLSHILQTELPTTP